MVITAEMMSLTSCCIADRARRNMEDKNGNKCLMSRMYSFMSPSYVPVDDHKQAARYLVVLDALVENSSAHGLPTFYRASGYALKTIIR